MLTTGRALPSLTSVHVSLSSRPAQLTAVTFNLYVPAAKATSLPTSFLDCRTRSFVDWLVLSAARLSTCTLLSSGASIISQVNFTGFPEGLFPTLLLMATLVRPPPHVVPTTSGPKRETSGDSASSGPAISTDVEAKGVQSDFEEICHWLLSREIVLPTATTEPYPGMM